MSNSIGEIREIREIREIGVWYNKFMPGYSAKGLTSAEANKRLTAYGPNILPEKQHFSAVSIFVHQFTSPLIYVLLGAIAVTLILGDLLDAAVIGGAVGINTILGFIQEYKAETTLAALKKILTPKAKVIRDGETAMIPASELVPGDTVILSPGDHVPADGRVVEAVSLFINEAMITGESLPVEKRPNENILMGTVVVAGRGKMEVTKTGEQTMIGEMAQTIALTKREETPLQREIGRLSRTLAMVVFVLCGLLFLLGLSYGEDLIVMLKTAVAIAVSAIPEGLAVSLTVILAIGMQRVMKRKALVRRMVAAETLGSVSTICVDKTGTITQGVMRVVKTDFTDETQAIRAAVLANNLEDPLEIALWDWARAQDHIDPQKLVDGTKRISEIPFDSIKKYMAVTTRDGVWVKGAPEAVLGMSDRPEKERDAWMKKVAHWGSEGLRVIALGNKGDMGDKGDMGGFTFLGIIGIADPVREGVAQAVAHVRKAGVAVTMVTGDYRATAEAVLRAIGLAITNPEHEIMEGSELAAISEGELARRVREIRLFCRASPDQKYKIVSALQAVGEVVAMTGDGVNDALAIKKADIGIVVAGASDVARETADVVLLDSNFKTIVAAIEEGRAIFDNIRKLVLYLLSNAFVEMILLTLTTLFGLPLPLAAIQILWINLVDDGFPTLALAVDPRSHDLMRRSPRPKAAPILDHHLGALVATVSLVTAFVAFGMYGWAVSVKGGDLGYGQTMVFTLVAVSTLIQVFPIRVLGRPLHLRAFTENRWLMGAVAAGILMQLFAVYHPWGNQVFGTVPLPLASWGVIFGASAIIIGMIEVTKKIRS